MSTELNLEEIEARCSAGREMVSNLCKRRGEAGSREWVMSIPARPDYDPDLVIGASLHDVPALCEEVRRLREEQAHDKETIQVLGLKLAMAEKETERLRDWQNLAAKAMDDGDCYLMNTLCKEAEKEPDGD